MNKLIKIFSVTIIILTIISLISGCIDSNAENKHISNGEGEEFTFLDTNGNLINLSNFRRKIVVLDMWATWCSPCGYQMLELEKLYNYYDKEIIEIISLDIDQGETIKMVKDYINEFQKNGINLNWIFGMDTQNIWEKYKIGGGIPTLYIFDQNGKIHYNHEGLSVFSEIPNGWPKNTITLKEKIDELII